MAKDITRLEKSIKNKKTSSKRETKAEQKCTEDQLKNAESKYEIFAKQTKRCIESKLRENSKA